MRMSPILPRQAHGGGRLRSSPLGWITRNVRATIAATAESLIAAGTVPHAA